MWENIKLGAKEYKKSTIIAIVLTSIEIVTSIAIPMVMASMIDQGILEGDFKHILNTGLIMAILSLIGLFCGIIAARLAAYASTGFSSVIRFNLFDKIQKFSFSKIDKYTTGELVTRMTTDVQNLQMAYQMSMRLGTRAPLKLIFALIMALLINRQLSIIFVIVIVFLTAALGYVIYRASSLFNQVFEQYGDLNQVIRENVRGIRVVKAFVREDYENTKFYKASKKLYDLFVEAQKKVALNAPIMTFANGFAIIAISWFGSQFIISGRLTPGELTSFLSYLAEILMSLMMLSGIFVMFMMAFSSAKRIAEIQKEVNDIKNPENPIYEIKDASISFENVSFSFSKDADNLVLNDINLEIKSGETIGIVGSTGSGKSALVKLLPRLYDVTFGSLKLGGIDVRKYDIRTLRDEVSFVLQKNTLFRGSVLENLRWGNESASLEDCIRVCKIAQAHDFIEKLPNGYNSNVEQGGSNFSGGQRQRLCIARALLKDPKVIIFDDSTSAVDTQTDRKIQEALREERKDLTKIVIAQRISSVENADKIIVIDDGKINGFDSHENLVKNNKIYKEIYKAQMESSGDFDLGGLNG